MKLFNTLTRKVEEFVPLNPPKVTVYTCGPTVYNYAHIGNFRTYLLSDVLVRTLRFFGYEVFYVMNITDVGHLVSEADTGEDKLEKGSQREGKSAWEIARYYTEAFINDSRLLNLVEPQARPKPTQHIPEQIQMVETLLLKGYAYQISDGIYFDTAKFSNYGQLTRQLPNELLAGARVEVNPEKRHPGDFALWKFSPKNEKRQMEWESPWGKGFPGWHIECSAMSRKYLGDSLDIHCGGVDLIPIHHTNEIAQSEAATGISPYVHYWVHGQFIKVDGEKMSKSKGNFYTLNDLVTKGFRPLSLRYLYLTAHYRAYLNFTFTALSGAANAYTELIRQVAATLRTARENSRVTLSPEKLAKADAFRKQFENALADDLNLPRALATVFQTLKSNVPPQDKLDLIGDFDQVLGLGLISEAEKHLTLANKIAPPALSGDIMSLVKQREELRMAGKFDDADTLRLKLEAMGYSVVDAKEGSIVRKKNNNING
jgi:cysteinyl-tRNA synthetase